MPTYACCPVRAAAAPSYVPVSTVGATYTSSTSHIVSGRSLPCTQSLAQEITLVVLRTTPTGRFFAYLVTAIQPPA